MMAAGPLPEIATAAGVPLPTAGLLVGVFALTVVVGGPVLALTTTAVRRRRLLAVLLALTVRSSAFNLGITGGGWLGGRVIATGAGLRRLPVTGGLVALAALAIALVEHLGERRRTAARTVPAGHATPGEVAA